MFQAWRVRGYTLPRFTSRARNDYKVLAVRHGGYEGSLHAQIPPLQARIHQLGFTHSANNHNKLEFRSLMLMCLLCRIGRFALLLE